ncbi:winged helix-turn-helix domain-containing tetratricopeptide repeat protein [Tropicimonas aquimaris]|uniref:Winged helix-turn-helix domain-containing tetratricopeptide repeat protein n=1 Tax=Tropicimonas aquimaris TaxID=914152 RepID=A0ABW3IIX7_9RHOB
MKPEIDPKSKILLIGQCQYDIASGSLTDANGTPIRLRRQSSDVLAVLAANNGKVVSRDDLITKVWKGVAITDDSLIQCIADIRRVLGKQAVETYPKVGYRLTAARMPQAGSPAKRAMRVVALTVIVAVSAGAAVWQFWSPRETLDAGDVIVPPRIVPEKTLAVLPFVNLGGGAELQYFGDGLSEDLTTDLSKVTDLTVIAYASSGDFVDAEAGFSEIATDLGVRYLVRGTVRHSGERVRINVSLIDPYEGTNVWAERFDRVRQDPFDVQEDVTRAIVEALSLTLQSEDAPSRVAPDAYFMLLRGLEPLRENSAAGNRLAIEYFHRALELDPNYARAHAYIAVAHGRDSMFNYSGDPERSSVRKGLEAAVTAIQLHPDLPNAYFALGILNLAIGEHDKALAAARHSIRLNRNFADGYAILAEAGVYGGNLSEALEAIQHAKRLHPHHPASYHWIEGHIHFQLGDYEAAQLLLAQTVEQTPGFLPALVTLAAVYAELDDKDRGKAALAAASVLKPGFTIDSFLASTPYASEKRRSKLADALGTLGAE